MTPHVVPKTCFEGLPGDVPRTFWELPENDPNQSSRHVPRALDCNLPWISFQDIPWMSDWDVREVSDQEIPEMVQEDH